MRFRCRFVLCLLYDVLNLGLTVRLQVKITTDSHELVDEPILSPITTKRFSDQSMPKDMESSHHSSEIGR